MRLGWDLDGILGEIRVGFGSDFGEITLEDISDANLLKFTPESGIL